MLPPAAGVTDIEYVLAAVYEIEIRKPDVVYGTVVKLTPALSLIV